MASFINRLIPRFAELTWDGLIPEMVVFDETFIFITFTYDSTRASIQPLRIFISLFCCSGGATGICGDPSVNGGTLRLLFDVHRKIKQRWVPASTNIVEYNNQDKTFQCPQRVQRNGCLGMYDTSVPDIDFYSVLSSFGLTSVNTVGSITNTPLHELIINDVPVCNKSEGVPKIGNNIIFSVVS